MGTFSFYYSHHISTLEGGMCVTGDADLAEQLRILRAHGWVRDVEDPRPWTAAHPGVAERFLFVNVGYNLRPTEPAGAMGLVQLAKLDRFVAARRASAAWFADRLGGFGDVAAAACRRGHAPRLLVWQPPGVDRRRPRARGRRHRRVWARPLPKLRQVLRGTRSLSSHADLGHPVAPRVGSVTRPAGI